MKKKVIWAVGVIFLISGVISILTTIGGITGYITLNVEREDINSIVGFVLVIIGLVLMMVGKGEDTITLYYAYKEGLFVPGELLNVKKHQSFEMMENVEGAKNLIALSPHGAAIDRIKIARIDFVESAYPKVVERYGDRFVVPTEKFGKFNELMRIGKIKFERVL
ncbi:hypothetical protein J4462_00455 [Candidatus Pacearchaeota archaeon]|nr:hypothetical protein [Candidatus Pacearchaeota archaeon]